MWLVFHNIKGNIKEGQVTEVCQSIFQSLSCIKYLQSLLFYIMLSLYNMTYFRASKVHHYLIKQYHEYNGVAMNSIFHPLLLKNGSDSENSTCYMDDGTLSVITRNGGSDVIL